VGLGVPVAWGAPRRRFRLLPEFLHLTAAAILVGYLRGRARVDALNLEIGLAVTNENLSSVERSKIFISIPS
jgi:hypothetical protein